MKTKILKKIILSIAISIIMILSLGQNIIYAAGGNLNAALDSYRYLPTYDASTNQYTYNSTGWRYKYINGHYVYQINELDASNNITGGSSRLYCLNARVGDTWDNGALGSTVVNYDTQSNLKNPVEVNQDVGYNSAYDISKYQYYSAIVWLLDNFYIPTVTDKESFLESFDIYKDPEMSTILIGYGEYNPYFYNGSYAIISNESEFGYCYLDKDRNVHDVVLTDDMIEVVQQSAIWYFTNYLDYNKEDGFNHYTTPPEGEIYATPHDWLYYSIGTEELKSIKNMKVIGYGDAEVNVGMMYLEQASILYNYLIDRALEANSKGYTGAETVANMTMDSTAATIQKQDDGKYKIGPLKINKTGIVSDLVITVQDATGNNITCTIPETIVNGIEFYIENIPAEFEGNVIITANAKGNTATQTLWTKKLLEGQLPEQPIVEINKGDVDLTDKAEFTIIKEKYFDLALRKTIVEVKNASGAVVSIINENGLDASRTIKANVATIPDTATYKHRKDPVVVGKDFTVTYRLSILNEGDIDGYASVVVDQLATGLESTLVVGDTLTSLKDNTYQVESYNDNKIVLKLITANPTAINAFDSTTGTLDRDTIDLECKVTQKEDPTKHYLTNIAYISEAKDKDGNIQEQDRYKAEENIGESKPSIYPIKNATELNNTTVTYQGDSNNQSIYNDTNNEYYYKGQEDDDDFETVVLLAKEFDLKLVKYISAVNNGKSNRVITANTSSLNKIVNGIKITTADYDVSKLPITVETGDLVTYTFRIYNEADLDGYASKIIEDIPERLRFIYSELTDEQLQADTSISEKEKEAIKFNRNFGWNYTASGANTISTNYLSKEVAIDNLIKAFDSTVDNGNGEGLSYKEVSVMFEVTSTDTTKIIRNEAAIADDTDSEGQPITDRDSDTTKWEKENSEDYYENNTDYPKYVEDDEDYDNIRLFRFDISLRKFITAVSSDITIDEVDYLTGESARNPVIDSSKLKTGENLTAIYNHSKNPIALNARDYVLYTIRVYNEGDLDGYASKITDYLPSYLSYIDGEFNTGFGWTYNAEEGTVTTDYLSSEKGEANKLAKFDKENDDGKGSGLSYKDVQILCRVKTDAITGQNITNIAEITEYQDAQGDVRDTDTDSDPKNLEYPENVPGYEGNRSGENASETYYPGQEDDDDFDRVIVLKGSYDVILIKKDEKGEQLNSKATFEVNGENKDVVGSLVIADDVEINASNLSNKDEYTIKEITAPNQYSIFNGIIKIQISKKQSSNLYEIDTAGYRVTDLEGNELNSEDVRVYMENGNIYVEVKNHKKEFDLKLVKYISAVNNDDTKGKTVEKINTTKLALGQSTTAEYQLNKDVVTVQKGDFVTYTFRVYNEGEIDGYVTKITDNIPNGLQFVQTKLDGKTITVYNYNEEDGLTSKDIEVDSDTYQLVDKNNSYWTLDKDTEELKIDTYNGEKTPSISIDVEEYLSGENVLLKAYDSSKDENNDGKGLSFVDVTVVLKVADTAEIEKIIRNEAAITGQTDSNGNSITDRDSQPENWVGKDDNTKYQDDEDYDNIKLFSFDLALRKFITRIDNKDVTTRIPKVSYVDGKITYTHPKDVVKVVVGDIVTYTIRVYNEGKTAGIAQTVTDDIPEYLEYLPGNETNVTYKWKMFDKAGNETEDVTKAEKIVTDYAANKVLNPFNPDGEINETNPEYVDVKVAFKVKDPDSSSYIIKNKAQISEDSDKNGNPIDDIDSKPNEWNEGEDDQDYENISVEYFDLSLLKYVSAVEVTENGVKTTTKTGNKGGKDDIIPKVEIHRKKLDTTTVKFVYTIKVTNEGEVPGYVKEITDYVPEGLEFNLKDNNGWKEKKDGIIVTDLLADTLLNPGESATVKVTFRWINDEDNMGSKINRAEISKDDNIKDATDKDSEPGNDKDGEDDIDDAEVLISIKTGLAENIIAFIIGGMIILLVLASGIILIKKFVL